jgi:hypothetical protein
VLYLENSLRFANLFHAMNYNTRLFWLLNISVWLLHYTIQGTTSPIFLALGLTYRLVLISTFLAWIMLITGSYRFVHQKLNFSSKTLQFTAIQIIVSAVIMTDLDLFCRFVVTNFLPFGQFLGTILQLKDDAFGHIYLSMKIKETWE